MDPIQVEKKLLSETVNNEILNPTIDTSIDYSEIALDSFFESGVLKEIPIIKSLKALYSTGVGIKDYFFVKKLLVFLKAFHSSNVDNVKLNEFKNKFSTDKKHRNKVIETIIVMNDKFLEIEKSKILAYLFQAHINSKIAWDELTTLCFYLDKLHPIGYKALSYYSRLKWSFPKSIFDEDGYVAVLISAGLAYSSSSLSKELTTDWININKFGQHLYEYGIRELLDD